MSRSTDATVAEKQRVARELRQREMSYREIAARMGISHQVAHEYCNPETKARNNKRRREHYQRSPEHQAATIERLRDRRRGGSP